MEIEQLEIHDFLSSCSPINQLNDAELEFISSSLEIAYFRAKETLLNPDDKNYFIYLIRTGSLSVFNPGGELSAHLGEKDWVGHLSALQGHEVRRKIVTNEDSLLYAIPTQIFKPLVDKHEVLQIFFSEHKASRLRHATKSLQQPEKNTLVSTQVDELVHGKPLIVDANTSISAAAKKMTENSVTSMLVQKDKRLIGIVTDRAFCTKVVATGTDTSNNITDIMSPELITLPKDAPGSEALLLMARHNVRHIPILDHNVNNEHRVLGMVTAIDLIRRQSHNTIFLINEIRRANSIEELKILSTQLPDMLVTLVDNSLSADDTAHAISSVGEAICIRLLEMAETKYGKPPVPYAFVLAGSQARNEQVAHSDQDNMMIISDDFDEALHDQYFLNIAKFVSDGLDKCGYIYCPGDVMASNKKWRQPLSVWKQYFNKWITEPEPKALMYACIFFDMRCIYGDETLCNSLKNLILGKTPNSSLFLRLMANNALHYRPPISLFKQFILEKSGFEQKALNMKKRGVVPIIDLARVYALEAGIPEINTQERLKASAEAGTLSHEGWQDLRDAMEFISTLRLEQQAKQIKAGQEADNYVPPETLSSLERRHLKDAFEVVSTLQTALERRF